MKVSNPCVISDVYRLVKTVEFDLEIRGKFLPARVEVFQDTERKRRFRCRLWELEYYHVTGTFASGEKRKVRRPVSDEPLLVERTWELSTKFFDFTAPNADVALKEFLLSLCQRLKAEKAK